MTRRERQIEKVVVRMRRLRIDPRSWVWPQWRDLANLIGFYPEAEILAALAALEDNK